MSRTATVERKTNETDIKISIDLDGTGKASIDTPIPFLSHMLEQISRHGAFDLTIADVLGKAVAQALGDRKGIRRYGSATLPMDEALVTAAIDLSGRAYFVFRIPLPKAKLGTWDVELAEVFFEAFARSAQANLHLHLTEGSNLHHIVEITFKAFSRALRAATELDPRAPGVPSTKGSLD